MPVTWIQPGARRWDTAALAIPCNVCGATIGRPCTRYYASGEAVAPHQSRAEIALEFGFRVMAETPLMETGT